MSWQAPGFLELSLLALAVFRVWRLLGEDAVLDRPRGWVVDRLEWGEEFVTCPWCAGFWISLVAWLAWVWQPHWTLVAATPFALSALVGLVAANLDPE